MLEVSALCAGYGESQILQDFSFRIGKGEAISILGRNGSGRSTLLKSIMGVLVPYSGSVQMEGEDITGAKPFQIVRRGIAYVPEERLVFTNLTVDENLSLGRRSSVQASEEWTVDQMYAYFPRLAERRDTLARHLSGGEQQMLTMARSLLTNPKLILIDEPTEGLAPKIVDVVMNVIVDIQRKGIAVILVEQKLTIALKVVERVIVVGHGTVVFEGTPSEFSNNGEIKRKWLEVS
ncbi:MAG: ABC transporter ATP-binding protein [Rhizobiaceae bacterium]|nr:ABC transporter ATP-binding protein [Rhizobiaceae bacterium]